MMLLDKPSSALAVSQEGIYPSQRVTPSVFREGVPWAGAVLAHSLCLAHALRGAP